MTPFVIIAALIAVAAIARLLPPLLRARGKAPADTSGADRRAANLAIFRDQLDELERERAEDSLSAPDFEQAKRELQRRLLEEVRPETDDKAASAASTGTSRKTAIALILIVPLAATAFYLLLGNPNGLDPLQTQPPSRASQQQIDEMLGKLVGKLKQNPDDSKGWIMLARSYKVLGRFAEAADAYGRALAVVDKDAALLADYAEVLSQTNDGKLQGRPAELLDRALRLDPDEPQSLFLAGAAASERLDFAKAADHWDRLLRQLEPGSEEETSLRAAVAKAREIATRKTQPAAALPNISGEVALSPKIAAQARPDDVLFVFARADDDTRMPLAVMRGTVGDLPMRFRFDDSMALPGGRKLSEFKSVSIEARVAKAGKAQTSSGDLFGKLGGVKPGSQNLHLFIDQIQP